MSSDLILPVILCGGGGTRLWPLSRESYPKQYLEINNKESITFLQKTLSRLNKIESIENRMILFDASRLHTSTNTTNVNRRVNINFNYF